MDYAQFVFFIKPILFFDFCAIMLYYKNSHGQNEVNQVKKQTLVPLITFLLGISTDDSLLKMLYLAMTDITKKWTGRRQRMIAR